MYSLKDTSFYIFLFFLLTTTKSSSDSSASVEAKLGWNNLLDAEETFEVSMAELKPLALRRASVRSPSALSGGTAFLCHALHGVGEKFEGMRSAFGVPCSPFESA